MRTPFHAYAELIARQLSAIQEDDYALLATLTDERDALASAIDAAQPADPEDLAAARDASRLEQELIRQIRLRRDEQFGRIRKEPAQSARLLAYARAAQPLGGPSVDLSL